MSFLQQTLLYLLWSSVAVCLLFEELANGKAACALRMRGKDVKIQTDSISLAKQSGSAGFEVRESPCKLVFMGIPEDLQSFEWAEAALKQHVRREWPSKTNGLSEVIKAIQEDMTGRSEIEEAVSELRTQANEVFNYCTTAIKQKKVIRNYEVHWPVPQNPYLFLVGERGRKELQRR